MTNTQPKKLTLRERKLAQPNAQLFFSPAEKQTIVETVAKGLTEPQQKIFFYTCQALGLNPLLNEIACVTYKDKDNPGKRTMSIQVMRDGFLTIAHRSGKFAGLESGVKTGEAGSGIVGWAKVYHKDFTVPVYQEAEFNEYNTNKNLWVSKPHTMIKKVAESMALRKAFNVNGVYAPEEMEKEIQIAETKKTVGELSDGDSKATEEQLNTLEKLMGGKTDDGGEFTTFDRKKSIEAGLTKQQAAEKISELLNTKK